MVASPFDLLSRQRSSLDRGPVAPDSAIAAPQFGARRFPSVVDLLSSRRLRLLLPAALILGFFVLGHRYDALPGIPARLKGAGPGTDPAPASQVDGLNVNWSSFAYTQYVTNSQYLCNSVMLFERLQHLGSRADRVMMYPSHMLDPAADETQTNDARLLIKARDEYNVKLVPIEVLSRASGDKTWAESFTKLLAFNQTQYRRVLSLDSDSTLLQPLDELFLLPPCRMAMPRAYWLFPDTPILSSQIMLLEPSVAEFTRVMTAIESSARNDYDMEIVNHLYGDSALVLPHRPYDMLTSEFRAAPDDHRRYLGSDTEKWDPVAAYNEAKFVHFSDWPVPKPWLRPTGSVVADKQPACYVRDGMENCAERDIWNGFYSEFRERRQRVCGEVDDKQTP